jgi:hypothetical protein
MGCLLWGGGIGVSAAIAASALAIAKVPWPKTRPFLTNVRGSFTKIEVA